MFIGMKNEFEIIKFKDKESFSWFSLEDEFFSEPVYDMREYSGI